jgi:two-component system, NtrC family, sensor kinase
MNSSSIYENYFRFFKEIRQAVQSSTHVKEVLEVVVNKTTHVLKARGALLRILNKDTGRFEVCAACGMGERYLHKGPVTTEKILPDPNRLHEVIIITDIMNAPRVEYPQQAWNEGIRMMLDVPLTIDDRLIGLIRIYLEEQRAFTDDELKFILAVAEQCACMITRVQFIENQKTQFDYLSTQMDKMSSLGRMAAGIAHEINNPLTGILLYSSNMCKKVPKGGALEEGLKVIISETQRCKNIIQGLLDFARDKAPQKAEVDVNGIFEKALSILENEFHLHHVRLEKRLTGDMINAFLDENQIEQVLINILLNALHAVEADGVITVESGVDPEKQRIRVEIADNGCGISEENVKKIFDPFFSTKSNGTGLGLAVSYGIIQSHQGDIRVFSKPGKGTRFVIDIPVSAKPAATRNGGAG